MTAVSAGCRLEINGPGSLKIVTKDYEGAFSRGISVYGLKMNSGTVDIESSGIAGFYSISFEKGDGKFLGGTVNIKCGDTLPEEMDQNSEHAGIFSFGADLLIKDTEVNIDLGSAYYFMLGLNAGSASYDLENSRNGTLTLNNALIRIHVKNNGFNNTLTACLYQLTDESGHYYFVGTDAADKRVDAGAAFPQTRFEGWQGRRDCTYNYLTILPRLPEMDFADVKESDWYYSYVKYMYEKGMMTGLQNSWFGAADTLARAQFALILYRMNGEEPVRYAQKFPDVPEGSWYTDAVLWANRMGIINGYTSNGLFGPADNITREQMAVMLYRYAVYKKYYTGKEADFRNFTDASAVSGFARRAMRWAVGNGIITGTDGGTRLNPQGYANRAECSAIMEIFVKLYAGNFY